MNRLEVSYDLQSKPGCHTVSVRLISVLHTLLEATQEGKAWVQDFADEQIVLSRDLYEVIQAARQHAAGVRSSAENEESW